MSNTNVKSAARQLIDQLHEGVTWDELAYEIEVRASIERGLADANAGRVLTHEEVEKRMEKWLTRE
jgi:predicted transcriptional regulator